MPTSDNVRATAERISGNPTSGLIRLFIDDLIHALLDCRRTFSLYGGKQLVPRDAHWISNYPAGHPQRPTFATHTCGQPIPSTWTIKETP